MMQTESSVQESAAAAAMLHQKQLFDKLWKGTFKAVAMPRPESVIVASIIARAARITRRPEEVEAKQTRGDDRTQDTDAHSKPGDVADGNQKKEAAADDLPRPKNCRHRRHHHHRRHRRHRHRASSTSFGEELSLRPKGKKKKKKKKKKTSKCERKRMTRRASSCNLSPLRKKKKKKKKKNSKKIKRRGQSSKKSKHSRHRLKRARKDERKRKKSYGSGRRRGNGGGGGYSSADDRPQKWSRPIWEAKRTNSSVGVSKSVKTTSVLSTAATTSSSKLRQGRPCRKGERSHDCDSGNDTSSPPSCEPADKSRASSSFARKDDDRDQDVSDSGNSLTSYASLDKAGGEDRPGDLLLKREDEALGCRFGAARSPQTSSRGRASAERHRGRRRSTSSRSSRDSGRRRFPSSTSASSYSRSASRKSGRRRRRGSLSSGSSTGSRYTCTRYRSPSRKRVSASSGTDGECRLSRKRRRRKSYSPMRKRRRDSPSHLEARRITSARKRPVPYLRRSPSSCSSTTSPSSLFLRRRSSSSSSPSSARGSVSRSPLRSFGARRRSASRY
ncbi:serine/arginine repetitive matrix protein 4 [Festucalex cinctus]